MKLMTSHSAEAQTGGPDHASALLDVKQVALWLHISARQVARLVDAGRMPGPVRLGRLVRWRRAEVLAWIAGGCKPVRAARLAGH